MDENALHGVAVLRDDATRLLTALDAEVLPDAPGVAAVHDQVRALATGQIELAKAPITIGVVGEYSVGKSMLLGSLLGRPDLLPVRDRATTGNVTALHLEAGAANSPTEASSSATLHFLSRAQFDDCVDAILDELVALVTSVEVQQQAKTAGPLRDLRAKRRVSENWAPFETWCRTYLWPVNGPIGGLEQRKIAVELLGLRDSQLSGEALLGTELTIDRDLLEDSLDLGDSDLVPTSFPERATTHGLTKAEVSAGGPPLRKVFPLIRRVSCTVRVDPGVWLLDRLRDQNSLVLLDFPGLTASRSSRRDEYLSRTELRHVQTIITVYRADRAGNDVPHRFYTMLQQHGRDGAELLESILAVGNAFDRVKPPDVVVDSVPQLRAVGSEFDQFYNSAVSLVGNRPERLRLTSSVLALKGMSGPLNLPADEQKRLDAALPDALRNAEGWAVVGHELAEAAETEWASMITGFARDGGMSGLRELVTRHVQEHGLANKLHGMRRQRRELDQRLKQLEVLLVDERLSSDESTRARDVIGLLFDDLREQHILVLESAKRFRDPGQVELNGSGLIETARERAAVAVFSWPVWREILARNEKGLIPRSSANDDRDLDVFDSYQGDGSSADADTTDPLIEAFTTTYVEAVEAARRDLGDAVAQWLVAENDTLGPIRQRLTEPDVQLWLDTGFQRLRAQSGDNDWLRSLDRLTDLTAILEIDRKKREKGNVQAGADARLATGQAVPLRPDHALPWHYEVPEPPDDLRASLRRHQSVVPRIRREVEVALRESITAWIARDVAAFRAWFNENWERGRKFIPSPDQVRLMFPTDPAPTVDAEGGSPAGPSSAPTGSPVRTLLREWKAR